MGRPLRELYDLPRSGTPDPGEDTHLSLGKTSMPELSRPAPQVGLLQDGIFSGPHIRPSTPLSTIVRLFHCKGSFPCCYLGHNHSSDNRVNPDITDQLTPELQCALHVACGFGGRSASRRYFVAGERFSRQAQHYVVRTGGLPCDAIASHFYDVVRNRSDQRYKCRTASSQIQYAGLFISTDELPSYGLRRSDIPL